MTRKGSSSLALCSWRLSRGDAKAIGDKPAEMVSLEAGGLLMKIYSSKAAKYDEKDAQVRYMHLNINFEHGLPQDATGPLAELAPPAWSEAPDGQPELRPRAAPAELPLGEAHRVRTTGSEPSCWAYVFGERPAAS